MLKDFTVGLLSVGLAVLLAEFLVDANLEKYALGLFVVFIFSPLLIIIGSGIRGMFR